jgi:hypothetical protein
MCTTMNKPNSILVPVPINTVHYSINRIIYKSTNNCIYIYINIYIHISIERDREREKESCHGLCLPCLGPQLSLMGKPGPPLGGAGWLPRHASADEGWPCL